MEHGYLATLLIQIANYIFLKQGSSESDQKGKYQLSGPETAEKCWNVFVDSKLIFKSGHSIVQL